MILGDHSANVELAMAEVDPGVPGVSSGGDVRVVARVHLHEFDGAADAWIEQATWVEFVERLTRLERDRRGEATLESISPGELRLHISALDRFGHMGIEGRMMRYFHGASGRQPQVLQLEFGAIEFDPSLLMQLVAELNRGYAN